MVLPKTLLFNKYSIPRILFINVDKNTLLSVFLVLMVSIDASIDFWISALLTFSTSPVEVLIFVNEVLKSSLNLSSTLFQIIY